MVFCLHSHNTLREVHYVQITKTKQNFSSSYNTSCNNTVCIIAGGKLKPRSYATVPLIRIRIRKSIFRRLVKNWEGKRSPFFWRRNPTKTLGFLLPWFSPWFFVGFLLSPPPYAQSFLRKPSFLVLADFFPWFFKSKRLLGFHGVVYMLQ